MKKIAAIIGICLIGSLAQAQQSTTNDADFSNSTSNQSAKSHKQHDPQAILAEINKHLAKRQAEEQEATSKGRTDIAAAIQKIITDLNNMKTALNNKDMAALKTANEQRKQDREALESLRKADGQKHAKNGNSSSFAKS